MGVENRTVTIISCDICGSLCNEDSGFINIKVNDGDGRDVGPAYISGELRFHQPYGVYNGIMCHQCKMKWLKRYVDKECGEDDQ